MTFPPMTSVSLPADASDAEVFYNEQRFSKHVFESPEHGMFKQSVKQSCIAVSTVSTQYLLEFEVLNHSPGESIFKV